MRVEALTRFLDGVDLFEKGDIRTIPDERAHKLIAYGWVRDVNDQAVSDVALLKEVDLDIQNSVFGIGDSHG